MSSYYAYKNYPLSVNDLNLLQQRHFSFLSQCDFPLSLLRSNWREYHIIFSWKLLVWKFSSFRFGYQALREKCQYMEFFPHSDWIRKEILRIFPYSVQMRGNKEHKNSKYSHFSRGDVEQTTLTAINRVKVFEKILGRIYFCVLGH